MKILLVEDDKITSDRIARGLGEEGHVVDLAETGTDGLFLASSETFDIIIVDRMLPGLDGLSVVRAIRAAGNETPVLFLTNIGETEDRVEGLDAGGDDYLVKPYAFSELLARIGALMRRPPQMDADQTHLNVGDMKMDLIKRTVQRGTTKIELQPLEFRLLEYLLRHKEKVVTRTMLLEQVWDFHFDPKTKVVETNISRLRAKIDKPFDQPLLHTLRGAGYVLKAD